MFLWPWLLSSRLASSALNTFTSYQANHLRGREASMGIHPLGKPLHNLTGIIKVPSDLRNDSQQHIACHLSLARKCRRNEGWRSCLVFLFFSPIYHIIWENREKSVSMKRIFTVLKQAPIRYPFWGHRFYSLDSCCGLNFKIISWSFELRMWLDFGIGSLEGCYTKLSFLRCHTV